MAAQNILFHDYMRILTPEEINELTSNSEGDCRVSLTEIISSKLDGDDVELFIKDGGAKILPFKKEEDEKKAFEINAGENVIDSINRFFIREGNFDTALDDSGREVELATFIMNEKERFAYSQSRLKSKEVLNLYKKNSLVDIEQEKIIKDDLNKSTQSGILINKKQF